MHPRFSLYVEGSVAMVKDRATNAKSVLNDATERAQYEA